MFLAFWGKLCLLPMAHTSEVGDSEHSYVRILEICALSIVRFFKIFEHCFLTPSICQCLFSKLWYVYSCNMLNLLPLLLELPWCDGAETSPNLICPTYGFCLPFLLSQIWNLIGLSKTVGLHHQGL